MAETRKGAPSHPKSAVPAGFSAIGLDLLRLSVRLIDWRFGRCPDPPSNAIPLFLGSWLLSDRARRCAMGALDSSLVFFLPLGIDFVVILMSARKPELFWLYATLAALGSLAGAVTYWLGRQVGEDGLPAGEAVPAVQGARAREQRGDGVAGLAVIPPPFPFTAFVLTSGAFRVYAWKFFTTLAAVRALRFLVEGALAARYGRGILSWMESRTFTIAVSVLIGLAIVGTLVSAVAVYRSTRSARH